MKNTWASGAQGTPPAAPASPSTGWPTDGDISSATPPTIPGAYWFYQITQELLNVITAAGLTPSQSTLTQLKSALDALYANAVTSVAGRTGAVTLAVGDVSGAVATSSFTGTNQGLFTAGYQKFPGGLILQWGQLGVSASTSATFTFPIAFPSACVNVQANFHNNPYAGGVTETYPTVDSQSATSCVIGNQLIGDTAGTPQVIAAHIFAIGF